MTPELVDARPGQAAAVALAAAVRRRRSPTSSRCRPTSPAKVADALGVALADSARRELDGQADREPGRLRRVPEGRGGVAGDGLTDPPCLRRAIGLLRARGRARLDVRARLGPALPRPDRGSTATASPTPRSASRRGSPPSGPAGSTPERAAGLPRLGRVLRDRGSGRQRARRSRSTSRASGSRPTTSSLLGGARGQRSTSLGRWDSAAARLARAALLDPRSATVARRLADVRTAVLRQYPEARLRRRPRARARADQSRHAVRQGDGRAGRGRSRRRPGSDPARPRGGSIPRRSCAYLATYQDLYWVLDDAQQRQVLACRRARSTTTGRTGGSSWPSSITSGVTGSGRAPTPTRRGSRSRSRSGRRPRTRSGTSFSASRWRTWAGRRTRSAKGERGVALRRSARTPCNGPYIQHQLARIYMLVGEPEKALDQLEPLLKMPYYLSPGWLRIDPTFDPLRSNPRFKKLVEGRRKTRRSSARSLFSVRGTHSYAPHNKVGRDRRGGLRIRRRPP